MNKHPDLFKKPYINTMYSVELVHKELSSNLIIKTESKEVMRDAGGLIIPRTEPEFRKFIFDLIELWKRENSCNE